MTRPDETYARLSRRIAELVAQKAWFSLFNAEKRVLEFVAPGFGVPPRRSTASGGAGRAEPRGPRALRRPRLLERSRARCAQVQTLMGAMGVKRNAVFVPLRTGVLGVLVVCDKATDFDAGDLAAIQATPTGALLCATRDST
jgi:hypothetical protein